jgi:hypothetical protein
VNARSLLPRFSFAARPLSGQDRARISTWEPRRLLRSPLFWLSRADVMLNLAIGSAVMLASAVLLIVYSGPSWTDQSLTAWLNVLSSLLILALAARSARLTLDTLADFTVNRALASTVSERAAEVLLRLDARVRDSFGAADFSALLPVNPTEPPLAMRRLFDRIRQEAADLRFDSSVSVIEPYKEEAMARSLQLEEDQRLALRLGILGTFVGLIIAVSNIGQTIVGSGLPGLTEEPEKFITASKNLFNALGLSFGTSIAGLSVAVCAGLGLRQVRADRQVYFKDMEDVAVTLLSLATHSLHDREHVHALGQMQQALRRVEARMEAHTRSLEGSVEAVEERIRIQTEAIADGMTRLSKVREEFGSFLASANDAQKRFLSDLEALQNAASLRRLVEQIETGLGKAVSGSVERLATQLSTLHQVLVEMDGQLRGTSSSLASSTVHLQSDLATLEGSFRTGAEAASSGLQDIAARIEDLQEAIARLPRQRRLRTVLLWSLLSAGALASGAAAYALFVEGLAW